MKNQADCLCLFDTFTLRNHADTSETNQHYQALIIYLNEEIPLHFIHE